MLASTLESLVAQPVPVPSSSLGRLRAGSYLEALKQFDILAAQYALPVNYVLFFRHLRLELEAALDRVDKSTGARMRDLEDFESQVELDWVCNKCEYWLGPIGQIDLSCLCQKCIKPRGISPGMTASEYSAVKSLHLTVLFFDRLKHQPWKLFSDSIKFCRKFPARLKDVFANQLFVCKQLNQQLIVGIKLFLWRLK